MSLPVLAPAVLGVQTSRPANHALGTPPCPQSALAHSQREWEALYPEIERLYVRERRRLQDIMQFLESKYGFRATPQMYKKRFAKWGLQKNKKRWATADAGLSILNVSCPETDVKFMFLASVRTWNAAFYEDPNRHLTATAAAGKTPPKVEANEISFAFKMIVELLGRGYGELAGRLARKAFLLVEDLLTVDEPALLWNLLDLMHNMVVSHLRMTPGPTNFSSNPDLLQRHTTQLFRMLLVHLDALVTNRFRTQGSHPLSSILRLLRRLAGATSRASVDGITTTPNPNVDSVLEQAWNLNAKLLFENFSPERLHVYWYICWDGCSISLPSHVISIIHERVRQLGEEAEEESNTDNNRTQPQPRKGIISPIVREYSGAVANPVLAASLPSEEPRDIEERHHLPPGPPHLLPPKDEEKPASPNTNTNTNTSSTEGIPGCLLSGSSKDISPRRSSGEDMVSKLQSNIPRTPGEDDTKSRGPPLPAAADMENHSQREERRGASRESDSTAAAVPSFTSSSTDQTALLWTLAGLMSIRIYKELQLGPSSFSSSSSSSTNGDGANDNDSDNDNDNRQIQHHQASTAAWAIRVSTAANNETRPPSSQSQASNTSPGYMVSGRTSISPPQDNVHVHPSTPETSSRSSKSSSSSSKSGSGSNTNPSHGDLHNHMQRLNQIRHLIALKEQARGRATLQVIREMWAVEDTLADAREWPRAVETNVEWKRQLEVYLGDISTAVVVGEV